MLDEPVRELPAPQRTSGIGVDLEQRRSNDRRRIRRAIACGSKSHLETSRLSIPSLLIGFFNVFVEEKSDLSVDLI